MKSAFRQPWILLLAIALCAAAVYGVSLTADFRSMDDQQTIVDNEDIRSFANLGKIFTSSFFGQGVYYRPLVTFSNLLNYHFTGADPFFFNLTNLILHILAAFSVYAMFRVLGWERRLSFFVALVFAVHPVHWSAVTNVAGRAILLCSLFFINAFSSFVLFLRTGGGRRWFWGGLLLASFLLSLLSKESGIVLPVMVLAYWPVVREDRVQRKALLGVLVVLGAVAAGYLLWRASLGIGHFFNWDSLKGLLVGLVTFLRGVLMYLRLFVFPVDLHFDRSMAYLSFGSPVFIATLAVWIIAGIALWANRCRLTGTVKFLLGWFAFGFLPVSQIIPIVANSGYASMAEHFLYLPSVGMFALMVMAVDGWIRRERQGGRVSKPVAVIAVAGIYVFLMVSAFQQAVYSTQEIAMFERSLQHNPHNVRVRTSFGLAFAKRGLFDRAEREFRRALEDEDSYANARIGLGKALFDQGKYFEGIAEYEKVIRSWQPLPLARKNLDASYRFLIEKYRREIQDDPGNARLHYTLGIIFSKSGEIENSIEEYREAAALEPDFKNAHFNLGASYAAIGNIPQAIAAYERVLGAGGQGPLDYQACLQLGVLYEAQGDAEAARRYHQRAQAMPAEFKEFEESYVAEVKE